MKMEVPILAEQPLKWSKSGARAGGRCPPEKPCWS